MADQLEKIKKITLVDQAVIQLRKEIFIGNHPPGSVFPSETELNNRLSISKITIRGALKELEKEGLIEIIQGRGSIVKDYRKSVGTELLPYLMIYAPETITEETFQTFTKFIHWLQGRIMVSACKKAKHSNKKNLTEILSDFTDDKSFEELWEANFRFFRELLAISGDMLLMMHFNSFESLIRSLINLNLISKAPYPASFNRKYGKELTEIICENDMDKLFQLMPILEGAGNQSLNRIFSEIIKKGLGRR